MKKIFTLLSIVALLTAVMAACNKKPSGDELTKAVRYEDTVGFAQFQSWKLQNERLDPNEVFNSQQPVAAAAPVKRAPARAVRTVSKPVASAPAPAPAKKGWSKAAKGTAIGAGSGAVIGAVINKKNRVLGAVIGGVVGGGVGYGIGRGMDKKDGRY
jgi:hypothetical protein